MTVQMILHKGESIPVLIKRSLKAKQIRLTFCSEKMETVLTIPIFIPKSKGGKFLKEKEYWIKKQWDEVKKQKAKFPERTYSNGDCFWYLGEPLNLEIELSPRALNKRFAKRAYKIVNGQLQITIPPNLPASEQRAKVKQVIESFYKQKALEVIHDRLEYLNDHYQFSYRQVRFRNQKSRWGSCTAEGNLNFNCRLIMAPIQVIDYVVIHELCHLKELNHSQKFWTLVSQKAPHHKIHRKWLKENGQGLKL